MYTTFRAHASPLKFINNVAPIASDPRASTSTYAGVCTRCNVRLLAADVTGLCNHCSNYKSARKAAAELPNPVTAAYQTNKVLGKRKADDRREPRTLLPAPPCTVFQTRSGMYEALLTSLKTFYKANTSSRAPYISFHGSYSIIADPAVSNARQALLVSQDLQKIVKLPHRLSVTTDSPHAQPGTLLCRCDCDCRVIPSKRTVAAPPNEPSHTLTPAKWLSHSAFTSSTARKRPTKARQSNLSDWILHAVAKKYPPLLPTPQAVQTTVAPKPEEVEEEVQECEGIVRIAVTDDLTHPLFTGQKITVEVMHPERVQA